MRLLCLDQGAFALDFLMRCQDWGHDVRWYVPAKERTQFIGKGLVERVDDWRPWARWADLIFLPDNTKFLTQLEPYRRDGAKIVGPTPETAAWELDRNEGMRVFKRHGIPVPPYREFTDYDAAIAYVRREGRAFVSKPCGDEPDKSLSYVAKSPADLIYMLERWQKAKRHKGAFILQEKVDGVEMAVGGWFGPHGFNRGWMENWEEKKLMAGGLGVACFDETSEVLTAEGWKFWPDVTEDDLFCTLKDSTIVYDKPSQMVVADFDGELIGWQSETVDVLVTPNHNMYVQDDHARKPFFFEPAEATEKVKRLIMRSGGSWIGEDRAEQLPAFYQGSLTAWAALLGAYIADGSCRQRSVVFGNCPAHKAKEFTAIAAAAGFSACMYGKDLYINSRNLADALRPFGYSINKQVPAYIKDATPEVIAAFLRGYGAGDGSRRPTNLIYTTISRRLCDDLQELLLKIGQVGVVTLRDRRGYSHEVNGYSVHNRHISYDISVSRQRLKANLSPKISYRKRHVGKIYCVTVPSHVIYVRRNGKPCWIGQTGEMGTILRYVEASKLADKVLKPLAPALKRAGYCGYVDVNCIIDDKGTPWPLEFTMRPGWPLFNIQQRLHDGDPVTWLADLADGRDSNVFKLNEIAAGVVLAIPDFPYSHLTLKEVTGVPVYGLTPALMEKVHPCEMMQGEVPQDLAGTVLTAPCLVTAGDYVLVASGLGATVRQARASAYRVLKRLKVPNSPMWRIDIGLRLAQELPRLQAMGYATSLSF